jgi:multidrug resistance efflux pump
MKNLFASTGRVLLTLVVVLVAIAVGWQLWSYYMLEPWTRDGRVRADVVTVAADVSGLVSDVFVHDNEKVSKGQKLFRIDQRRFQYALDQAKADVTSRQATLDQAKRDLERAKNLSSAAITVQQVEQRQQAVDVDQAELDAANAALEVAQLNLERSTVVAPVNGIVTNFGLLPGRYVNAGTAVFALIDSDTFRVEGYFEETKLRRIRVGEEATVKLIGDARVLSGQSRASLWASRTRTGPPAASFWPSSTRPSAGCAWRSASLCASSSTTCRRTFFWSPGAPPLYRSGRSVGGEGIGSVGSEPVTS